MRDRESGFTLIEMMVTVAVIAILAVIVMPSFSSESRKTKAFSEVQPLFNDLRVRIEQFAQENGKYPPTIGEDTLHPPATPNGTLHVLNSTTVLLPQKWQDIKVRISGNNQVYCGYTWVTGLANDSTNIGPIAKASATATPPAGFGFTAPVTDWYYLFAQCDMNNDGAFSYYFSSSTDQRIQKLNEGS
jgi:prepilin-type N-terminal cleavage/methylation domain-containing protein